MKRYRPVSVQFDSRAILMAHDFQAVGVEPEVRELNLKNIRLIDEELKIEFGDLNFELKRKNFVDLGPKPFSIVSYHNLFLNEIRNSFICCNYFPALTAACSFGERLLNHLIRTFREEFKHKKSPTRVYSDKPLKTWEIAIDALTKWNILLPNAAAEFLLLKDLRHESLHYNPVTDLIPREKALQAVKHVQEIVNIQFAAHGPQPWYFFGSDSCYIKKEYEADPFVLKYIIPSCQYLSPLYKVESVMPSWTVRDFEFEIDIDDTDENYAKIRAASPKFHEEIQRST